MAASSMFCLCVGQAADLRDRIVVAEEERDAARDKEEECVLMT
jgi:hypothetical protein